MKKVLFILTFLFSLASQAQTGTFDYLNSRQRLTLRNWHVTDIKNDTFNWNSSGSRYLPTAKSVFDFVKGRANDSTLFATNYRVDTAKANIRLQVGAKPDSNSVWYRNGNNATDSDYVGTKNAVDLQFKSRGSLSGYLGANKTAFGYGAIANYTGSNITAIGWDAAANSTGSTVLSIGSSSSRNSSASNLISIGNNSSRFSTGSNTIAIGTNAGLYSEMTYSVIIGHNAVFGSGASGEDNVYVGHDAGRAANNTGSFNVAVGGNSMRVNTTGYASVGVGYNALFTNTSGYKNVAVGGGAMERNTIGSFCVGLGEDALLDNLEGFGNIGVGWNGLANNKNGHNSIGIGYGAGKSVTHANESIFIGRDAGWQSGLQKDTCKGCIAIGWQSYVNKDSTASFGASYVKETWLFGSVGISNTVSSPDQSAMLDINSTTKGFLPPRMTGTQAEAISSPAEGLMIFATTGNGTVITSKGWWGYDGSTWVKLN
jgi:hypothetical protein